MVANATNPKASGGSKRARIIKVMVEIAALPYVWMLDQKTPLAAFFRKLMG
jgi:hypothetical protein